jgi:molybdopterin-guanine dinucleotide biosynthesis protein A
MPDALVLAGGGIERKRFRPLDPGIVRKAQIPIHGRPMVEWVARALRTCPEVGRVVVIGHESLDTPALRALEVRLIPEAGEIAANLRAGVDALPGAGHVLAVSGDLPLLTCEAVEDLFTNAPEADVVFPYVEREDIVRRFPDRHWIYARSPEGAFTGCSAFLFRPDVLLANWRWVEEILNARRKSPLEIAAMFGLSFAFKLLFRQLRIADVEKKISSLLHLAGRGYRTPFPELAMDVDKYTDIALVERVLKARET